MRLLMISNQPTAEDRDGFRQTYGEMVQTGELASFRYMTPVATAATRGHEASLTELWEEGQAVRPDVILVATPKALGHDPSWIGRFLRSCGDPAVLYWEGDPWHGWARPINRSMKGWAAVADIVFTHAREPHVSLFRRGGARDVRFVPEWYGQGVFGEAERTDPLDGTTLSYDAVVIGNRLAHWGRVSRTPGAVQRATLVRRLQRQQGVRLAIYGAGWSGRAAKGALPYAQQAVAIRQGLMSVNWDHFPGHESCASDRLPISMIAGRVHVTTAHPNMDWVPDEQTGLFQEPTVSDVLRRVRELMAAPVEEVLDLGAAAHQWVRRRLSNREAARFMLGAIDKRLLVSLPAEPWLRLVSEWPE